MNHTIKVKRRAFFAKRSGVLPVRINPKAMSAAVQAFWAERGLPEPLAGKNLHPDRNHLN